MGKKEKVKLEFIWEDKRRGLFGLPTLKRVKYGLTEDRLLIETGVFARNEEEIRLYRILDVSLKRSLHDRIWGLGSIHCCSADKSAPEFDIAHVKDARRVKELLSGMVEEERERKGVAMREGMMNEDGDAEYH